MNGDEFDDEEMELRNKLHPLCGCANAPALKVLRDCLLVMQEKLDTNEPGWFGKLCAKQAAATGGGSWEIVMHLVEQLGWSEHGGGINASWLEPKGEVALAALVRLLEIDAVRDQRDDAPVVG